MTARTSVRSEHIGVAVSRKADGVIDAHAADHQQAAFDERVNVEPLTDAILRDRQSFPLR